MTAALGLTKRQSEVLQFIRGYIAEHSYSPSYREIQAALAISSISSVYEIVDGLEERGRIRKARGMARSISVVELDALA
jgi:repressor LexA